MCSPVTNPFCSPALGLAGQQAAEQFLGSLAEATSKAASEVVKMVLTWWVEIPSAEIGTDADQVVPFLRGHTQWLTASLAVLALFIAAIRMALERNGREAAQTAKGMVWLVLVTGAGVATVNGLGEVGDWYSEWIIDQSTDGQFSARINALAPGAVVLTSFMAIILFLFVVLSGLAQVVLMFGRDLVVVGLTGLLPVAAAAGAMGAGRQMRDKYLAWLLAALLYKPTAATVYAIGFKLVGDGQNARSLLLGLVTFAAAVVALPALLRLITPAVSVVASGGAGGAALAGVDAVTKLASGAMDMTMSKGSSGGGIGGGPGGGPGGGLGGGGSAPTGSGDGPSPGGGDGPGSGGNGLGAVKPAMPSASTTGAESESEPGSAGSPAGTGPASGAGDGAMVGAGGPGGTTGGTMSGSMGGSMGGGASGAAATGGAELAGAAGGPVGMAAVAGAETAEKAATAGPKAISAVGGAAASGAEEVGQ